jgi:hypothetical protein
VTLGHGWARHCQQPLISAVHAMRDDVSPGSASSATRTRDLLLRRHNRPSTVQTSNDARYPRAKQPQAVALGTIMAAGCDALDGLPRGRPVQDG